MLVMLISHVTIWLDRLRRVPRESCLSPFLHLSSLFPSLSLSIMPRWNRTMVLVTSFVGAIFNTLLAIQLFALWRSLRRDSESEWEGSLDPWTVNTLSLLGGLSAAYFVTAAVASAIGFAGIVKVSDSCPLVILLSWAPTKRVWSCFAGHTGVPTFLS